jgi:hypothetical protein
MKAGSSFHSEHLLGWKYTAIDPGDWGASAPFDRALSVANSFPDWTFVQSCRQCCVGAEARSVVHGMLSEPTYVHNPAGIA